MALSNKGYIKINNTEIRILQSLQVSSESLSGPDAGRDLTGVMHPMFVRDKVYKLQCKLRPCSSEEIAQFFNLVSGKTFTLEFFSPIENTWKTINAYCNGGSADMYSGVLYNGLYQNASINLIQM